MATSVAALQVTVGADVSSALSGLNKINSAVSSTGGFFGRAASTAAGFIGGALGLRAVTGVSDAVSGSIFGLNDAAEQSGIAFETMLGSASKAQGFLAQLTSFAANTPFTLPGVTDAAKRLLAFGFSANQVLPLLTNVGDVAAGMGTGQEGINRITLALGQMQAKGKVSGDELLQLTEAGIPGMQLLAGALGKSVTQTQKLVEAGKVPSSTFFAAFQSFASTRFGGLMAKQALTFSGAMSTIKDSLGQGIARAFFPFFDLVREGAVNLSAFVQSKQFDAFVGRMRSGVAAIIQPIGTFAVLWGNLAKVDPLGPMHAGLVAVEMMLAATFGPAAAGMFHNFIDFLGQLPVFLGIAAAWVSGTLVPALGQLWTWLQTNLPSAWATLSAAVQAALAFLGPGFVQALTNLQAQWVLLQPQLLAAGASFGNLLTALVPVADFLANNMGPILAGFGAAMAVAFTPAAFGIALTLIGLIAGALLALASPIVLISGLIGFLAAAWVGNWGGIQDKVLAVWAVIQPIFAAIGQWLGGIGQLIGKVLGTGATTDWTKMLNPVTAAGTLLTAPNVQAGLGAAPGLLPTALAANAGTRIVDNTQAFDFTGLQINANDPAAVQALLDRVTAAAAAGQSAAGNTAPAALVGGS